MGIVWSTTTRTRVDATAVTFSAKCFNPLKLHHLSGNIFRKWFASYFLFIHEHLIIMWSPTVTLVAVTTLLLTSGFRSLVAKHLRIIQIIFMLLEWAFHQLFCLKFLFNLLYFLRVMQENNSRCFFLNTVYNRHSRPADYSMYAWE